MLHLSVEYLLYKIGRKRNILDQKSELLGPNVVQPYRAFINFWVQIKNHNEMNDSLFEISFNAARQVDKSTDFFNPVANLINNLRS